MKENVEKEWRSEIRKYRGRNWRKKEGEKEGRSEIRKQRRRRKREEVK